MPNPAKVAKPGVRSRNLPDSRADTDAYAIARALIETHVGPDRTIRSIGDFLLALADALKSAKDNQAGPRSTVVTFGTFDVFHYGHLRLLERAAQLGDRLVVGVSTDELSLAKKGRRPVYREQHRKAIVSALACVDGVFDERSMDEKPAYLHEYGATKLVMGSDWAGAFDQVAAECGCEAIYLERTPGISSTEIIEVIGGE